MFGVSGRATQSNNQNIQFTWKVNNILTDSFTTLPIAASSAKGSMFFKSDGTKLYRVVAPQGSSKYLYSYDLATPWDLTGIGQPTSTKILEGNINLNYITSRTLFFSNDGTKVFVGFDATVGVPGGNTVGTINRYDLSTAWDVTTASYSNKSFYGSYDAYNGIFFKSDGLRMYVSGSAPIKNNTTNGAIIGQYTLGSAWDITATTLNFTLTVSSDTADRVGNVAFSPDGLNLYVTVMKNGYVTTVNNYIKKYTLSTAWDISTATFANQLDLNFLYNYYPVGLTFSSDGTKMFVSPVGTINNSDEKSFILTFDLSTAWDITTASITYTSGNGYKFIGDTITPNRGLEFDSTGSNFYVCSTNGIAQYTSNSWNVGTSLYVNSYSVSTQSNAVQSIRLSANNSKMFLLASNTTVTNILEYTLSVPSDISTSTYNQTKNISTEYPFGGASALDFSPDGTKMLIGTSTSLRKYDLSIAWDISTAVANTSTFSYSGYNVGYTTGIKMKPDGKKLIIASTSDYKILSFDFSSAWDLSSGNTATVSYTNTPNTFHLCADDLYVKPNGGKLFTINGSGYVLSHSLK